MYAGPSATPGSAAQMILLVLSAKPPEEMDPEHRIRVISSDTFIMMWYSFPIYPERKIYSP